MEIKIQKTQNPKTKPDPKNLGFGVHFTDHMFTMDYSLEKGWHNPQIIPYSPLELDPATMVFHYAQELFEGLKAYKTDDGRVLLFRPEENMKRLNVSCERLCVPKIYVNDGVEAIKALVNVDKDWIPTEKESSLYIRPFIIATEAHIGVKASSTYKFIIILSPVGAYYKEGINPVKIYVETKYTRAVKGGVGHTKAGANYAASLIAQEEAKLAGYSQVLWLDALEKKYIEEVGTMNVFFVIGDTVCTPELGGSILAGITRKSCLEILKDQGYKVSERKISLDELKQSIKNNELKEAFGTGTAAVISPIGQLKINEDEFVINQGKIGPITQNIYDTLTAIQWGRIKDKYNYTVEVK